MDKILAAFNVFAPTDYYFDLQVKSIKSFADYIRDNKNLEDVLDIYYSGWVPKEEHRNSIANLIKTEFKKANFYPLDKNYGKSISINNVVFNLYKNENTQFLFTADSDIIFLKEQKEMISRLVVCSSVIQQTTKRAFGLIALNQNGSPESENCHWVHLMTRKINYQLKQGEGLITEHLMQTERGDGIAGGALFINLPAFRSFGGYILQNFPYGADDAHVELFLRQRSYVTAMLETLSVIHPKTEKNEKYIEWKKEAIKHYAEKFEKEIYLKNVESSMEFWKNYDKN